MDQNGHADVPNSIMGDGSNLPKPLRQQRAPGTSVDLEPDDNLEKQSLRTSKDCLIARHPASDAHSGKRQKVVDNSTPINASGQLNVNDITHNPEALGSTVGDQRMSVHHEKKDDAKGAMWRRKSKVPPTLPSTRLEAAELIRDETRPSSTLGNGENRCAWRPPDPTSSAIASNNLAVESKGGTPGKLDKSDLIEQSGIYQAQTLLRKVDDDRMYTHGPARIIRITSTGGEGGTLALQLSHELSRKMITQIEAGRKFRATREAVDRRTNDLIAADARIYAEQIRAKEELEKYLSDFGERELTPEESTKAHAMVARCNEPGHQRAAMKKEREQLPQYLQGLQNTWLERVKEVEAIHEDVFVKRKLISETTELESLPWDQSLNGDKDVVTPDPVPQIQGIGPTSMQPSDEAPRLGLAMRNRFTKAAMQVAREKHDEYRQGYEKGLKEYIAKQVNRPNVDFRIEFSHKWLEGWHDVIVTLEEAEKAAQDAYDRARAANVTVADSMDDGERTLAYDIEWWDKMSLKQLDRNRIERWQNDVVLGDLGPTHPAGKDEAELEQQSKDVQPEKKTAEPAIDSPGGAPVNPSERQPVVGSEGMAALPALHVSNMKATPLQKIEQLLAEVTGALDRASELTSTQAHKPGRASAATGTKADEANKRTSAVHASSVPPEDFAGVSAEDRMAEAIDLPRRVVSQAANILPSPIANQVTGKSNPGGQNIDQGPEEPSTSKGRTEHTIILEPKKRQNGEDMDSQLETDLKGYMKKYNIPPPPISRKRDRDNSLDQRDVLITGSERAYGSRRRRIDKWGSYVRGGDC
ncbi:uncharacterized protein J4E79_007078 [Alternaria viburni]|uniref:uncharacterized protein n=1 Tax=Alternaria viburni TaxID=566460 RepID=UPI0020C50795|nr:uncharacterized protein J4E79_007078 [Alternaria viburni]KAI4658097.1 hypothetical protein J4E79_007078 [Alternaria viburni]